MRTVSKSTPVRAQARRRLSSSSAGTPCHDRTASAWVPARAHRRGASAGARSTTGRARTHDARCDGQPSRSDRRPEVRCVEFSVVVRVNCKARGPSSNSPTAAAPAPPAPPPRLHRARHRARPPRTCDKYHLQLPERGLGQREPPAVNQPAVVLARRRHPGLP